MKLTRVTDDTVKIQIGDKTYLTANNSESIAGFSHYFEMLERELYGESGPTFIDLLDEVRTMDYIKGFVDAMIVDQGIKDPLNKAISLFFYDFEELLKAYRLFERLGVKVIYVADNKLKERTDDDDYDPSALIIEDPGYLVNDEQIDVLEEEPVNEDSVADGRKDVIDTINFLQAFGDFVAKKKHEISDKDKPSFVKGIEKDLGELDRMTIYNLLCKKIDEGFVSAHAILTIVDEFKELGRQGMFDKYSVNSLEELIDKLIKVYNEQDKEMRRDVYTQKSEEEPKTEENQEDPCRDYDKHVETTLRRDARTRLLAIESYKRKLEYALFTLIRKTNTDFHTAYQLANSFLTPYLENIDGLMYEDIYRLVEEYVKRKEEAEALDTGVDDDLKCDSVNLD